MVRFVLSIINVWIFFSLLVIDKQLCESVAVTRGEHDTFQKPFCSETGSDSPNCTAMNARCVTSHNTSTCSNCTCFGQYKTYVSNFRGQRCSSRCVRDNTLLFFPVRNNSFMIQETHGPSKRCITYNQLNQNIAAAECNSTDPLQKWIWTWHDQIYHVETLKCIRQLQNSKSLSWYLGLQECNISETKQKWRCNGDHIETKYIIHKDGHIIYMAFENNMLKLTRTLFHWKRYGGQRKVCSSPFGCNAFSNPYSAILLLSLNFSQEGERQIGTECIPETKTISSNMFGQYLDANSSWKKLNSTKQSIFRVHKKAQGISLKWNLTAVPSTWNNMIIKLKFYCGDTERCVLVKLKTFSADCLTTSLPTTPSTEIVVNSITTPQTKTISTPTSTSETSDGKMPTSSKQESTTTTVQPISSLTTLTSDVQSDDHAYDNESSSVVGIVVGLLVAVAALSAVILGIVCFRKRRRYADKASSNLEINDKGQSSGDTLNPVYSSEVTSNPSFLNNGGIYQEPDCNINEASKACELYEPSGDHEYDYAKVEAENNKPAAPADDLEYDYAKSDEIKSAVNRLPVKYNHYHNPNVNNQNASTNAREKKETGEKENDAGSLYQVLENDTGPVYQTLDEE